MIKISISWQADGPTKVKEYSADAPFPSETEADIHGITFGQRIIDAKVPGLSLMEELQWGNPMAPTGTAFSVYSFAPCKFRTSAR